MDVRKTLTDAGYIAVGLGVMGYQQAQVRRRQLTDHAQSAGGCVAGRARAIQDQVGAHGRTLDTKAREARDKAEGTVNQTVARVQDLATELPERFAQAIEPVTVRVRERFNRAA